jgi:co-chaperonin GroES (HSP10)
VNIKPRHNLALVEVLPRRDEVHDYTVADGKFVDLSDDPAPQDFVVAVRQWLGEGAPQKSRYVGERTMPQLRRAKVLAVGPEATDIHIGDIILVGIFAGLEVGDDSRDLRFIAEHEALLHVGDG